VVSKLTLDKASRGGRVQDALLLACAAKLKAQMIDTWNLKHYQAIARELAAGIRTP
jgi:hypothetical protein